MSQQEAVLHGNVWAALIFWAGHLIDELNSGTKTS